jgi:hypothetical protein
MDIPNQFETDQLNRQRNDKAVTDAEARLRRLNQVESPANPMAEIDAELKKLEHAEKSKSLSVKFRESKAVGGTDQKGDRGDGLVETIDIPEARDKFAIPQPDNPGNIYGGWIDHAGRPIDFYRGDRNRENPATDLGNKARPEFFKMLEKLGENPDAAAREFTKLQNTGKPTDIAFILSVVGRERRNAISSSVNLTDTFGQFGLDNFYKEQTLLANEGYLPSDFPHVTKGDGGPTWQAVFHGRVYNELGRDHALIKAELVGIIDQGTGLENAFIILESRLKSTELGKRLGEQGLQIYLEPWKKGTTLSDVQLWKDTLGREPGLQAKDKWKALLPLEPGHEIFPAKIPENRMIEACGAVLNKSYDIFLDSAKKPVLNRDGKIIAEGFSEKDMKTLSSNARRVWTSLFFSGPGDGKAILSQYKVNGWSLENIVTDETNAQRYDNLKTARVRAAEAYIIEKRVLHGY